MTTIPVMARIAGVVAVGYPHPVAQRGNFRRDIFLDDHGRQTCLDPLAEAAGDARLRIWGHCPMPKAIRFIVVPERPGSMAKAFRIAHSNSSRWLNIRLRRCGHIWQNRHFSCPLDPAHAGLGAAPTWPGSQDWAGRYPTGRWCEALGLGFRRSGDLERLREAMRTGRPFGGPDFVAELEAKLDRALSPQKRGPKPGAAKQLQTAAAGSSDV